ncbi:MAG: carbohydrate ABC transporter permease, partial [Clostridiales bacterium]|nr:carbohydrate ABC transporter permease [Clostridiales bacterium]
MGRNERKTLNHILFYGGNTIIALIFVSPLIWMIASSLKPEQNIFSDMSSIRTFWPTNASLANYLEVFSRTNMLKFILNSLGYVFVIVVLDLLINSICGYALAKFHFRGKELLLTVVISLMVLPMESIMLPLYIEVARLGWVNTWAGLIVPFIGKCFSIYMFRQFFLDVPD